VNLIAEHARTVVVVADRSILGRGAFAAVLTGMPPHLLVTDGAVPGEYSRYLQGFGVRMVV
jgi:hypothetical protein